MGGSGWWEPVPGPDGACWPSVPALVHMVAVYSTCACLAATVKGLPGSGHAKLGPMEAAGVWGSGGLSGSPAST